MRIGVITFSGSKDNYGQLLQCYAMQVYLRNRGHEPFLIRYHDTPIVDTTGFKVGKLLTYLRRLPEYLHWYIARHKESKDNIRYQSLADFERRDFEGFLSRNIEQTPVFDKESIETNPPVADVYICGSDQIWAGEDAYYLSFAPDNALKIAYAPSLGGIKEFPKEKEESMRVLINRLDRIGMREQSGVDVCQRLGRTDAIKVADPTLLLNGEDYLKLASPPDDSTPYALIYLLGNTIDLDIKQIYDECQRRDLKIVYIASQGRNDDMPKCDPTIEQWLGLMSEASLVITNSFHCTVFALQFHRNFITIPLSGGYGRMNTRVEELLSECHMQNRFTSNLSHVKNTTDSDFEAFEAYKKEQQQISCQFLSLD